MLMLQQGRHNTKTTTLFLLLAISLSTITLLAYANDLNSQSLLDENSLACTIACHQDSDCDDENPNTIDVCNNDATCDSQCRNLHITLGCNVECSSDPQCDDQNPLTTDVCNNDKTCQAQCTHIYTGPECEIACNNDSDCDDENPNTIDICNNDGTCESYCTNIQTILGQAQQGQGPCGNNHINKDETCDGNNLNGETCQTQGFECGTLSCTADCTAFNTSPCYDMACHNDQDCDDLNSETADSCESPGTCQAKCTHTETEKAAEPKKQPEGLLDAELVEKELKGKKWKKVFEKETAGESLSTLKALFTEMGFKSSNPNIDIGTSFETPQKSEKIHSLGGSESRVKQTIVITNTSGEEQTGMLQIDLITPLTNFSNQDEKFTAMEEYKTWKATKNKAQFTLPDGNTVETSTTKNASIWFEGTGGIFNWQDMVDANTNPTVFVKKMGQSGIISLVFTITLDGNETKIIDPYYDFNESTAGKQNFDAGWDGGASTDLIGFTVSSGEGVQLVNADNGTYANDLLITAPYANTQGLTNNGAIYLIKNIDSLSGNYLLDSDANFTARWDGATTSDNIGYTYHSGQGVQLVNADNGTYANDLLIGALYADTQGLENNGAIYLIKNIDSLSGNYLLDSDVNFTARWDGATASDRLGYTSFGLSVQLINVENGAYANDLLIAASYAHTQGLTDNGAVYLIKNIDSITGSRWLKDDVNFTARWDGGASTDKLCYANQSGSANDYDKGMQFVNADNGMYANDLLITAPKANTQGLTDNGAVYLIKNIDSLSGTYLLDSEENFSARWDGATADDFMGDTYGSGPGAQLINVDNGTYANDLLIIGKNVETHGLGNNGIIYLIKNIDSLSGNYLLDSDANFTASWEGAETGDGLGNNDLGFLGKSGRAVQVVDVDNNGYANDLLIGVPYADTRGLSSNGSVYLIKNIDSITGSKWLKDDVNFTAKWDGGAADDQLGYTGNSGQSVQLVNADNGTYANDLLIGAPYADTQGLENNGAAYLIKNIDSITGSKWIKDDVNFTARWDGGAGYDLIGSSSSGRSVQLINVENGAYANDLLITAISADTQGLSNNGAIYLIKNIDSLSGNYLLDSDANFTARWDGASTNDQIGYASTGQSVQLVNADKEAYANDLLITASHANTQTRANNGAVYLIKNIDSLSGNYFLDSDVNFSARWDGASGTGEATGQGDRLGYAANCGQGTKLVNADNGTYANDLLITAAYADSQGLIDNGAIYLIKNIAQPKADGFVSNQKSTGINDYNKDDYSPYIKIGQDSSYFYHGYIQFDVTNIPYDSLITDTDLNVFVEKAIATDPIQIYSIENRIDTLAAGNNNYSDNQTIFQDTNEGTDYATGQDWSSVGTKTVDLGTSAYSTLQSQVNSLLGWFGVGITTTQETSPDDGNIYSFGTTDYNGFTANTLAPNLIVSYVPKFTETQSFEKIFEGGVLLGDVNKDGKLELFTTGRTADGNRANIYTGEGNGTFSLDTNLTGLHLGGSALGDVDNNGTLDLIATGKDSLGLFVTTINTGGGDGAFYFDQNLIGFIYGGVAVGDIDNNGTLDIILTGEDTAGNYSTVVYTNDGSGNFSWDTNLIGLRYGGIALADFDNDYNLDVVITGENKNGDYATVIYTGDGNGTFNHDTNVAGLRYGGPAVGDIDNDGDTDLVISGQGPGKNYQVVIYTGDGDGTFTWDQNLSGLAKGGITLGDIDNDGNLNIVLTGENKLGEAATMIFDKNMSGKYAWDMNLTGFAYGGVALGDIDNNGDLDIVVSGRDEAGGLETIAYTSNRNFGASANTRPTAPSSDFSGTYSNGKLHLSWGDGSDTETPANGLYYNIKVGTTSDGNQTVSPELYSYTSASGFGGCTNGRFGNAQQRQSIDLNVIDGAYYWSVQTIDGGMKASAWSTEQIYATLDVNVASPNGYEIIGVRDGNASIDFNVQSTKNYIMADIYYSKVPGEAETIIIQDLNLQQIAQNPTTDINCTGNGDFTTTQQCHYDWNVSIALPSGRFIIDINIHTNTYDANNMDSSDQNFRLHNWMQTAIAPSTSYDDFARTLERSTDGTLYLVFEDNITDENTSIYFTQSDDNGTTWDTPTRLTDTNYNSYTPRIDLNSENGVQLTWQQQDNAIWDDTYGYWVQAYDLYYASCLEDCNNTSNWTKTNIYSSDVNAAQYPAILVTSDDQVHVAYYQKEATSLLGKAINCYISCSSDCHETANWSTCVIASDGIDRERGLGVLSTGKMVHAGCYLGGTDYLNYTECSSDCTTEGNWSSVAVITGGGGTASVHNPSMLVDSNDTVHIVYTYTSSGGMPTTHLAYIRDIYCASSIDCTVANNWTNQTIGSRSPTDSTSFGGTTVTSNGTNLYAFWSDNNKNANYDIWDINKTNGSWSTIAQVTNNNTGNKYPVARRDTAAETGYWKLDYIWYEGTAADYNITFHTEVLDTQKAPDVNIWKIGGYEDNQPIPPFSYTADGNLTIDFNIHDPNPGDTITADINYSTDNNQGSGTTIVENLTLGANTCDDADLSNQTKCTWDWNIFGITDNNYYINILVSDGTDTDFNATDNNFSVNPTTLDVNVASPNGYEVIGVRDGNASIDFNVQSTKNYIMADIYYSKVPEEAETIIIQDLNLQQIAQNPTPDINCTGNGDFTTTQQCHYDWNVSIALPSGRYIIDINIHTNTLDYNAMDSSDQNFRLHNWLQTTVTALYDDLVRTLERSTDGTLYLVFEDKITDENTSIYFTQSDDNGTTWDTPIRLTDTNYNIYGPRIDLNSENGVQLTWYQQDNAIWEPDYGGFWIQAYDLYYASCLEDCNNTSNWAKTNIYQSDVNAAWFPSILVTSDDETHIAYWQREATELMSYAAQQCYIQCSSNCHETANWSTCVITSTGYDKERELGELSTGKMVHVGYYGTATDYIYYTECSSDCTTQGNWSSVIKIDETGGIQSIGYVSMLVDSNDMVHVTYAHTTQTGPSETTLYMKNAYCASSLDCTNASNWTKETIAIRGVSKNSTGATITSNGTKLYAFWSDNTENANYDIVDSNKTNGSWSTEAPVTNNNTGNKAPIARRDTAAETGYWKLDYIWYEGTAADYNITFHTEVLDTQQAPDVNVWKIDEHEDNQPIPPFSYTADGNLTIDFNVHDPNPGDSLTVDINYSTDNNQGSGTTIVENLTLGANTCDDADLSNQTKCTWDWNIFGITDNNYYINILVSDGTDTDFNASDNNFLVDNNAPKIYLLTPANGSTVTEQTVTFDVNKIHHSDVNIDSIAVGVNGTTSGIFDASSHCTADDGNYLCSYTETAMVNGSNTLDVNASDLVGNAADTNTSTFTGAFNVAPDLNIWKVNGWDFNAALPEFSYADDGNLPIKFRTSDADDDDLNFNMWYDTTKGEKANKIVGDVNLSTETANCDTNAKTGMVCTWDWNISGIADNNYWITIEINDATDTNTMPSLKSFKVDNIAPNCTQFAVYSDAYGDYYKNDDTVHLEVACNATSLTTTFDLSAIDDQNVNNFPAVNDGDNNYSLDHTVSASNALSDGQKTVSFNACDVAGNCDTTPTNTITLKNTEPSPAGPGPGSTTETWVSRPSGGAAPEHLPPPEAVPCSNDTDCETGYRCVSGKCAKFFDVKILRADTPIKAGQQFDFTYLLRNPFGKPIDAEVEYWLEKNSKKIVEGREVVFVGAGEETQFESNLLLLEDMLGKYRFVVQLIHEGTEVFATKDIEIKTSVPLTLDLHISRLPEEISFQPFTIEILVGTNFDERTQVRLNQVIMRGNEILWKSDKHVSVEVSRTITQRLPVLQPGEYRLTITATSGEAITSIIRSFNVKTKVVTGPSISDIIQEKAVLFSIIALLLIIAAILAWHYLVVVRFISPTHPARAKIKFVYFSVFAIAFFALLGFTAYLLADLLREFALNELYGLMESSYGVALQQLAANAWDYVMATSYGREVVSLAQSIGLLPLG